MSRKPVLYEKPQGVRDYLPHRAKARRNLEKRLAETYQSWGYQEVVTPTFEYLETFQNGLRGQEDRVFKFIERSGKTVVLRPDMTAPIARVVSSLLRDRAFPMRFFYTASIFRQQPMVTGRDAEFTQAGIELFGDGSPDADAEIIALSIAALQAVGIAGFRIAIGQVAFLHGFLMEHLQQRQERQELIQALVSKDLVQYDVLVREYRDKGILSDPSAKALFWLPNARGGRETLSAARQYVSRREAVEGLENLEAIWHILTFYGVTDFVQLDLGLLPDLEYYTGCVLEGYAPGIGFPVVSGGRYNELTQKFGRAAPATGFMIGVERVLEVLERKQAASIELPSQLFFDEESRKQAISFCLAIRKKGYKVACSLASDPILNEGEPAYETVGRIVKGDLISDNPELIQLWSEWTLQKGEVE